MRKQMSEVAARADKRITDAPSDEIHAARRALSNSLAAIGLCHWCESPITTGRVFCSTGCCQRYENELQRREGLGL